MSDTYQFSPVTFPKFSEDAKDTPPPTTDNTEEAPRKRRGRPPGSKNSTTTTGTVRRSTRNVDLANAAADVLVTTNSMIGVAAGLTGFPETQEAIVEKNDLFRTMVVEALISDPELCKKITAGGGVSSRMALVVAYAMFASYVVPTASNEFREKRDARREARGELTE